MMPLPTAMRIASYTSSIHSTGTKPVPAGPLVCVSRSMMSPARRIAQAEEWFGAEPATDETPEKTFARRWALAVLETAHAALRQRAEEAGKAEHFALLGPFLAREPQPGEYEKLAPQIGASANAIGVAVHRLRQQYREALREELGAGQLPATQVEVELQHLADALR